MLSRAIHDPEPSFPFRCIGTFLAAGEITKGIVMAQNAIDDFMAVHSDPNQQMNALRTLEEELISVLRSASGDRFDLANTLIGLIDDRLRAVRISQKHGKFGAT